MKRKELVAVIVVRADVNDKVLTDLIERLQQLADKESMVPGQDLQITLPPPISERLRRFLTCLI